MDVPGTHRLVNVLRKVPHAFPDYEIEIDGGLRFAGTLNEHIDREIFYFGHYAEHELSFLRFSASIIHEIRGRRPVAADVGANIGQHSLYLSRFCRHVYAFEPAQLVAERFRHNVLINRITNITLYQVALGDCASEAKLGAGFSYNSGSRSLVWSFEGKGELVQVVPGDSFFGVSSCPVVDMIKIDCEGYEHAVLRGLARTIARDRPLVLFELTGSAEKSGFKSEEELRDLFPRETKIYTVVSGRARFPQLLPFQWRPTSRVQQDMVVCVPEEMLSPYSRLMAT